MWVDQLRKVYECHHISEIADRGGVETKECRVVFLCRESCYQLFTCSSLIRGSFYTRYVNGHAKAHHEDNQQHSVCLDASLTAFW